MRCTLYCIMYSTMYEYKLMCIARSAIAVYVHCTEPVTWTPSPLLDMYNAIFPKNSIDYISLKT